jgi:hypothetical protein
MHPHLYKITLGNPGVWPEAREMLRKEGVEQEVREGLQKARDAVRSQSCRKIGGMA